MVPIFTLLVMLCSPPSLNSPHGVIVIDYVGWDYYLITNVKCAGDT
jgi:hypothetical protein